MKRYLINGMEVPKCLRYHNKKPWEVENIDTANVRKSMATKYTSLDIVCKCL
jgi:hypothetical protein